MRRVVAHALPACCASSAALLQRRRTPHTARTLHNSSSSGNRSDARDAQDGAAATAITSPTGTTSAAAAAAAGDNTAATHTRTPGKVRVRVTDERGAVHDVLAPAGMTLMEAIRDVARVDLEAACDGTCTCSTCHVILSPASYAMVQQQQQQQQQQQHTSSSSPSEDELDMLDLAPHVTPTSRLSCQITLSDDVDGIEARLPRAQ